MKRVICLYRVSTVGQVDHDDIPMQKLACREYAATHPDWEIVDEISEKGVSGYKVSANARDAILEIKKRALLHQFEVLLVFMFDRLGRRDDETPFVVQWFVQQGVEVWSTKEGEQRFDNHVDKLLNYIRFWQASGESEKTAIRVKTKQMQMVQSGEYRGGLIPYGYRLEKLGRTNRRNQPVNDLVIDESEAAVVRKIYDLLINYGYGTNRVAQYLNDRGINTKRGSQTWTGSSVRHIVNNPIYTGRYHMQGSISEPFEHLRIIDQDMFDKCLQTVKGRAILNYGSETLVPTRTDTGSLLTGVLYCGFCGSKLSYNHHRDKRMFKNGPGVYDREIYRCYKKVYAKDACTGPSSYKASVLNEAVEEQVILFLSTLKSVPREKLMAMAGSRNEDNLKVAFKQAEKDFENAQKQVTALEEEAVKALTGESRLDINIVNQMLIKHRARLETARQAMDEAQSRLQTEKESAKQTTRQINELLSWADSYKTAEKAVRQMIISRLIERVEVLGRNRVDIRFRISLSQFLGEEFDKVMDF